MRECNPFNYRDTFPERCCCRCAFYDRGCGLCSYTAFLGSVMPVEKSPECVVSQCGLCDKWLSADVSALAAASSSFEEFRLKKTALGFAVPTPEFDDWFAARKTTAKQVAAVAKLINKRPYPFPPAMVDLSRVGPDGQVRVGGVEVSTSFETVNAWLGEKISRAQDGNEFENLERFMI